MTPTLEIFHDFPFFLPPTRFVGLAWMKKKGFHLVFPSHTNTLAQVKGKSHIFIHQYQTTSFRVLKVFIKEKNSLIDGARAAFLR